MRSFFLKTSCILSVILTLLYIWCINSVSIFGKEEEVTEIYSSFSSSRQIYVVSDLDYKRILTKCGECVRKDKNFDYAKFLQDIKAEVQFIENIDGGISIYAFSDYFKNFIKINDRRVNIQIHIKEEKILLATPIIFGSF